MESPLRTRRLKAQFALVFNVAEMSVPPRISLEFQSVLKDQDAEFHTKTTSYNEYGRGKSSKAEVTVENLEGVKLGFLQGQDGHGRGSRDEQS